MKESDKINKQIGKDDGNGIFIDRLVAGAVLGYLLASRKVSALQAQMELQQKHVEELLRVEKQGWQEKLEAQKQEVAEMRRQFNVEFENIANKIFQQKTESFNKLSAESLAGLLRPFGRI